MVSEDCGGLRLPENWVVFMRLPAAFGSQSTVDGWVSAGFALESGFADGAACVRSGGFGVVLRGVGGAGEGSGSACGVRRLWARATSSSFKVRW